MTDTEHTTSGSNEEEEEANTMGWQRQTNRVLATSKPCSREIAFGKRTLLFNIMPHA